MKVNSKDLYNYVNELEKGEKIKFKVYYNDCFITQVYWNGENFEWDPGTFTSEAFFNPLFDFTPVEKNNKKLLRIKRLVPCENRMILDSDHYSIDERLARVQEMLYKNEVFMLQLIDAYNGIIDYIH